VETVKGTMAQNKIYCEESKDCPMYCVFKYNLIYFSYPEASVAITGKPGCTGYKGRREL